MQWLCLREGTEIPNAHKKQLSFLKNSFEVRIHSNIYIIIIISELGGGHHVMFLSCVRKKEGEKFGDLLFLARSGGFGGHNLNLVKRPQRMLQNLSGTL